ncbi:hypothetical protein J1N35_011108 [Gossypium stocksii]|uniref:Secreted protein n=1 Tax=Gossypium stocksii TaxID=47602 RepID=A0A9D4AD39_9ROSI|nr:hypothetical protein J1N35_011108 [Gossypium stocksii]
MIGPHYFVLTPLLLVLTFFVNSKFARHVSTEHTVLFALKTGTLGGLHTYWTHVWMACKVCGPFSEFLKCMRSETTIFHRFLRVGFITLPCELDPLVGLRLCPVSSHKVPASWICRLALQAGSHCCLLMVGLWVRGSDPF